MSDEKVSNDTTVSDEVNETSAEEPTGWMYRERKILGVRIPYYASPSVQLVMVSFVCFLCPGMFNALSGLGGGGKADHTLGDQMVSLDAVPQKQEKKHALT